MGALVCRYSRRRLPYLCHILNSTPTKQEYVPTLNGCRIENELDTIHVKTLCAKKTAYFIRSVYDIYKLLIKRPALELVMICGFLLRLCSVHLFSWLVWTVWM